MIKWFNCHDTRLRAGADGPVVLQCRATSQCEQAYVGYQIDIPESVSPLDQPCLNDRLP